MVSGRQGGQKLWDLAERCLPAWTPRTLLSQEEVVLLAAQRSLKALGVAREIEIKRHFIRDRYPGLRTALRQLLDSKIIETVKIVDEGTEWPGIWYIHSDTLPPLEWIEKGEWQSGTTLLSPFDNLICDRDRTERLFDFHYRIEIYVPKAQRQYGYYVLPILHGDRIIGRIDPAMDRKRGVLTVSNIYIEPDAHLNKETSRSVACAISEIATFLGANSVVYGSVPDVWRSAFDEHAEITPAS